MLGALEVESDRAVNTPTKYASTTRDESDSVYRSTLGVSEDATWDSICEAHRRLVSDLTPGPGASHRRVQLALSMLDEVNRAFAALERAAVA